MSSRKIVSGGACLLAAWITTSTASAAIWRSAEPFVGITQWQFIQTKSDTTAPVYAREVVVNILEIDLAAAGIRFQMSPGNGSAPGEITRQSTRSYVNSVNAQVGINVGFYDTGSTYGGLYTDLIHLSASNGNVYSTAAGGEPVFNVSADNQVSIGPAGARGSSTFSGGGALYNAAGGNQRILTGGSISAPNDSYTNTLNPHTAIGISQDKSKVFLAVVDGRQTDYSEGMYTTELANVMKTRGAWDAINVDGGGSTTMVMDDSRDGVQNARLINSPSDNASGLAAGSERVVATSLAVFAQQKTGYTPLPAVPRAVLTGVQPVLTAPTVLDTFDTSKGHFSSAITFTTATNVDTTSKTVIDTAIKRDGAGSLRLDIVKKNPVGTGGTQIRFLSGGGTPSNNVAAGGAMGNDGYLGFFLRVEPGSAPLWVAPLIDDGTTTSNGLERGQMKQIVADGEWHLYQWSLNEDAPWINYNAGNGKIDGPNAFLDALYFSSANGTSGGTPWQGSIWIDSVTYNPNGTLDYLVPEPASLAALGLAGLTLVRRRRAR